MSIRSYSGPHSDRGHVPARWVVVIPWVLAGATILGQISWILVPESMRTGVTIATVIAFFLASATHAYITRGLAWAAGYLGITLVGSLVIEVIGVLTDFPFGSYTYGDALGPAVLGVPLLIPLAWAMMAYPVLLATNRLVGPGLPTVLVGGWLFASWDLFLDPQMVREGYWTWSAVTWTLPGIDEIPLQNFLGWLLAGFLLMWLLDRLPRKAAKDGVPILMLSWVYASNVLAAAVFFSDWPVALWGGICMGLVVIPWWWRCWSQPQW